MGVDMHARVCLCEIERVGKEGRDGQRRREKEVVRVRRGGGEKRVDVGWGIFRVRGFRNTVR
jgi:hypothetical protein